MRTPQIRYEPEFRCDQVADREREHWLEAMADSSTHKGKVNQMNKYLGEIDAKHYPDSCWETDATATHNVGDWDGKDIEWMLSGLWNQICFEMQHGCTIPSPCMVAKYMDVCIGVKAGQKYMEHLEANYEAVSKGNEGEGSK